MTLHHTFRFFLQSVLDWAKEQQAYWGNLKQQYQQRLDEEKLLAKLRKEAKQKAKAGK